MARGASAPHAPLPIPPPPSPSAHGIRPGPKSGRGRCGSSGEWRTGVGRTRTAIGRRRRGMPRPPSVAAAGGGPSVGRHPTSARVRREPPDGEPLRPPGGGGAASVPPPPPPAPAPGLLLSRGEGGRGFWTQNLVYQKWPDQIFPIVNFVFSHYGHFGLGRGGGGFGGGVPPCVTFRLVVAPLRGPGRSPVLPFA